MPNRNGKTLEQFVIDESEKLIAYWTPRDRAMDRWYAIYKLIDEKQMAKPTGFESFISDYPQAGVDRAVEILTGNDPRYHLIYDREQKEERQLMRKVEVFGSGLYDDINQGLYDRGLGPAEPWAAWCALVRGWICSEMVVTRDSGRDSPMWYNPWDPRWVYPRWDRKGMYQVVYSCEVPLAELIGDYPDLPYVTDKTELTQMVRKYIFYDRKTYAVVTQGWKANPNDSYSERRQHLLYSVTEEEDRIIPVQMVPVHGLNLTTNQPTQFRRSAYDARNTGVRMYPGTQQVDDYGQMGWTAMRGRSIYAAVERTIPQFNEFISNLMQLTKLYAYPTVIVYTRDGGPKEVSIGTGQVNTLQSQIEDMKFMTPQGAPPAIEGVLGTLGSEMARGFLPPALLDQADASSGFELAQRINIAMSSLGAQMRALDIHQEQVVQSALTQMKQAKNIEMLLSGVDRTRTMFSTTLTSQEVRMLPMYKIKVEREPMLPDDIMLRTDIASRLKAARLASDRTIYDRVLRWEDPDGEQDRIFADLAGQHPAIIAQRIRNALIAEGLYEELPVAEQEAAIQTMVQMMQMGQLSSQMQGITSGVEGQPQPSPENAPPEQVNPASETGMGGGGGGMMMPMGA